MGLDGGGRALRPGGNASLDFLLRAWTWPRRAIGRCSPHGLAVTTGGI
jgi:hypothetical protein